MNIYAFCARHYITLICLTGGIAVLLTLAIGYTFHTGSPINTMAVPQDEAGQVTKTLDDVMTPTAIQALVESDISDVSINSLELSQLGSMVYYDVHLSDGTIARYDAVTGKRISLTKAAEPKADQSLPDGFVPVLTVSDVRAIASELQPSASIQKIELIEINGTGAYSIWLAGEGNVTVDAVTGKVISSPGQQVTEPQPSGDEAKKPKQEHKPNNNQQPSAVPQESKKTDSGKPESVQSAGESTQPPEGSPSNPKDPQR